ncbi:hypothetical protein [Paenibacillus prosopidis]|uniref:DUF5983 domain-containing protein n=1 Tax=Paenibacillus prosopidis TaxID=630520 RepID=A0A368VJQ6_9BACL|nr:hypothetical protein [Paenibacillus prosopidis]RCW41594.1 hypothetical protein DFP97_12230 [Paenibacillus prosopidis]
MLMTNGQTKVMKWDEGSVEGISHEGIAFKQPALRDARGDAYFLLGGEKWYAKNFRTIHNDPIRKMLDISTGHVSKETIQYLDHQADEGESFIVYKKGHWGFFFPVLPEERSDLPEDLKQLLDYACSKNACWVMMDQDGEILDDLPFTDW